MTEINLFGMKCPRPLIETKKALLKIQKDEELIINLDDDTAKENIDSYLKGLGFNPVTVIQKDNTFKITLKKTREIQTTSPGINSSDPVFLKQKEFKSLIVIKTDSMGSGSYELGKILMSGFVNSLPEADIVPEMIIFYNAGINFVVKGSSVLNALQKLISMGVKIEACGTCLDYYQKKNDLILGKITNMYDIIQNLMKAEKVIYP